MGSHDNLWHPGTYGTLAKELGAGPEAARDVGQAITKNPVALIIPRHRVLAAGGKVGGFSAPGGSAAKIHMLALEGIHLEPPAPAQQSFWVLSLAIRWRGAQRRAA
jgi:methylated-DNA-[protein]-cysteine S-methyltransferase